MEPTLIVEAEMSSPDESLIVMSDATELLRTEPSKLSLKECGGGGSHATRIELV